MSLFVTGTGQVLGGVHPENEGCIYYGCVIHHPSRHHMREWPTHWSLGLMWRVCPHDHRHPDPDSVNWRQRTFGEEVAEAMSVHDCDGCCEMPA